MSNSKESKRSEVAPVRPGEELDWGRLARVGEPGVEGRRITPQQGRDGDLNLTGAVNVEAKATLTGRARDLVLELHHGLDQAPVRVGHHQIDEKRRA